MRNHEFKVGDKVLFYDKVYTIENIITSTAWSVLTTEALLSDNRWIDIKYLTPYKGEQMNDKEAAKKQLEALKAEMQKLEEIINKPEKAGSLLEDGRYFISSNNGKFIYDSLYNHVSCIGTNRFSTVEIAQAYAEAFNTMLELRKCEGSEVAEDCKDQYTHSLTSYADDLEIIGNFSYYTKHDKISPMFSTKEYAQAAIDKVGKEKIIKMFNTLHGIY